LREIPKPPPAPEPADNASEGEESEEEDDPDAGDVAEEYKGVPMLVWYDVFEDVAKNLPVDYDEAKFPEFKVVVDESFFVAAATGLSAATTAKANTDLASRCKVSIAGNKLEKVTTLVLWKAGL
jgi:hypothetical protein